MRSEMNLQKDEIYISNAQKFTGLLHDLRFSTMGQVFWNIPSYKSWMLVQYSI